MKIVQFKVSNREFEMLWAYRKSVVVSTIPVIVPIV